MVRARRNAGKQQKQEDNKPEAKSLEPEYDISSSEELSERSDSEQSEVS